MPLIGISSKQMLTIFQNKAINCYKIAIFILS